MREYIEFPTIHTFKIIGNKTPKFLKDIEEIFELYEDKSTGMNESRNAKYQSVSVTVEVQTYEELEYLYTKISKLEDLKFHV